MDNQEVERLREALTQITEPPPDWTRAITEQGLDLTRTEAVIFRLLQSRAPSCVTADALIAATSWSRPDREWPDTTDALYMNIKRLRWKISGSGVGAIETIHGCGYRWVASEKEEG